MEVSLLQTSSEFEQYNQWVSRHPSGSLWQSLEWKNYQEALGREVRIYVQKDEEGFRASALVVIDRTSFGLSTWEIARGPLIRSGEVESGEVVKCTNDLLNQILRDVKQDRCLSLYLSPTITSPLHHSNTPTLQHSTTPPLHNSERFQFPEATLLINLTQSEEQILSQMKPKGRYNIRIAQKHGVVVEKSENVDDFYALIKETATRNKFTPLPKSHYKAFIESLKDSFLYIAYISEQKKPIAGLLGVIWGKKGIYYYGASSYAHRANMAPYLLQWEAMRFCREKGCKSYDLFGIAPPDASSNHPWKGVTEFKEKFGGEVVRYPEEKVVVLKPVMNFVLQTKRKLFS